MLTLHIVELELDWFSVIGLHSTDVVNHFLVGFKPLVIEHRDGNDHNGVSAFNARSVDGCLQTVVGVRLARCVDILLTVDYQPVWRRS